MKQLVLEEREEAIDHAQKARIDRPAAEAAVNDLLLADYFKLTRSLPINAVGFAMYFVLIGAGLALAALGARLATETLAYGLLVPLGIA